ncbi:DUF383-domain-containing protein [Obba rivulosa]|uniref:DUF383-domain-containing protein n=1 Tax=Obba rivulosa TaxID=1052685 RepID=A0A8E2DVK5_9APHY|nr:DUF383-domain-containing protein [Obba rivulosa]
MSDQFKELIPFLHERNPQVRQIALANLLGQTPKGAPHRDIFFAGLRSGGLQKHQDNDLLRDLKLLCRDQLATAHDAFRALVNLSDNSLVVQSLSEPSFMAFLVSYILNPDSILADLASMLLSNLTTSAATCATLLSLKVLVLPNPKSFIGYYPTQSRSGSCAAPVPYPSGEEREVLALPLLMDAFVQGARLGETQNKDTQKRKGELHFLASVFANLSITPAGRLFFLTPRPADPVNDSGDLEYTLSKLLVFTEHKDTIRRGGVASTLKNCAFNVKAHRAMLLPETERVAVPPSSVEAPGMDVLPYLLLPLAGPEEFDLEDQEKLPSALQFLPSTKQREADPVIRLTHVETLLMLCTTRWGREFLRENGVYEIVRALHAQEKVEKISEHIERLVNFLKRDEGPDTGDDNIDFSEESTSETKKSLESDDEDNIIEEI